MSKLWLFIVAITLSWSASASEPIVAHTDAKNGFHVHVPKGWGAVPLEGRIVWHIASKNGTELPDCSVIVTEDPAFAVITVEQYIASQSEERLRRVLSLNFENVKIGLWEPNFQLGGQRALHVIYSGTQEGFRQTTFVTQTTKAGRLYTFSCNAPADKFPLLYTGLLQVADTFTFAKR